MKSKAHAELRRRHEDGKLVFATIAKRMRIPPSSLRYVVYGAEPKVCLALALERELGIPVNDWTLDDDKTNESAASTVPEPATAPAK